MDNSKSPKVKPNKLTKIRHYPNFYKSETGYIYYISVNVRFSTGIKDSITKARRYAEEELLRRSGDTPLQINAKIKHHWNPSLKNLWDEMTKIKLIGKAESTIENYNGSWKYRLDGFWGALSALDLNDDNILKYKQWYLANKGTNYFSHTLIHFALLVKHAFKSGFIAKMPDLEILKDVQQIVDKNAKRVRVGRILTEAEQVKLLGVAKSKAFTWKRENHRVYLGVLLGLRAGLRKMEGLSLTWDQVDTDSGVMKVWSAKNNKWRTIPLVKDLIDAFKFQKRFPVKTKFVFPMITDSKRHISSQIFDKNWIALKANAGFTERLRYHDLRHTFATMTAEAGWAPIVACEILDQSLKIYQNVYCKVSLESKTNLMHNTFERTDNEKT